MLVLAGGFGTRLKSVVSKVPKPLAPINGKPFLYYQIQNWKKQGIINYIFLLHHDSDLMVSFLEKEREGILKDCKFSWLIESKPLGTGGSIANCIRKLNIKEEFLVTNADTWLGSGFKEIVEKSGPTMAVVGMPDAARYGQVEIKGDTILSFKEKSKERIEGWINAGLCRLSADIFDEIKEQIFSIEELVYPVLAKRGNLKMIKIDAFFIDIGIPEDYYRFVKRIETYQKNCE